MRIEEALHTYLHVGDVEQVHVHGLFETEYLDKTDNFVRKTQTDPILTLHGATDRPYLNTTSPIVVDDPVLHRRITVTKSNSNTTVDLESVGERMASRTCPTTVGATCSVSSRRTPRTMHSLSSRAKHTCWRRQSPSRRSAT